MQAKFFDAKNKTCNLCKRRCKILPGQHGFCRVRVNDAGTLKTLTYGRLTACNLDPVEKKPLYHFLPSTTTLSISSFGCNFTCLHCQNYSLSQEYLSVQTAEATPEEIVDLAVVSGAESISFTYNEPTVFYEFMYDVSRLAKKSGIRTAMVTNGYITEEAFDDISPYMDAFRVDIKSVDDAFYKKVCGNAKYSYVLDTAVRAFEMKKHLELVTLIIPDLNDSSDEIDALLEWELENLGANVPHHFTAFTPMYHMKECRKATYNDMNRVFSMAEDAGLLYPYVGNVRHTEGSTTYCPDCGQKLILRNGYSCETQGLKDGACVFCGRKIDGVF